MVTVELTAFEAMQIQQALGERIIRLNDMPRSDVHPMEASTVRSAAVAATRALTKVVDALYPEPEPPDDMDLFKATDSMDNIEGDPAFNGAFNRW